MQLMRLADVPSNPRDRVFRYSPVRALLAAFAIVCVSGSLIVLGWQRHSGLAYYIAGVLGIALLVMRGLVLARLHPSNWLARLADHGLFIQYRSYLNHRFPGDDLTVVFLPYREIRSARLVRERRSIPDWGERTIEVTEQRRRLVEFDLVSDSAPLAQSLANECAKRVAQGTTWRHYPVRLASPDTLHVEWGVVPSAPVFLEALSRHTLITTPVEALQDFANLKGLSREDQEARLRELAETGETMAAITIARMLYSYDLAEARAFVEGLLNRRPMTAAPTGATGQPLAGNCGDEWPGDQEVPRAGP